MYSPQLKWLSRGDCRSKSVGFGSRGGPRAHFHGFEPLALGSPGRCRSGGSWRTDRCAVLEQPPGSVRPGAQDLWHRMERVRHGQDDLCLSALSFVETFPCCLSDPPKRHARVLRMKVVLRSTDGGNVHTRQV